jgi:hypothetical protein
MKHHLTCILKFAIVRSILFLAFVAVPSQATAQIDSTGPTTFYCSRTSIPVLKSVPPLHTDMNLQTLIGYVYWDSIMRSTINDSLVRRFTSIHTMDSLHQFVKFFYNIVDYDAALFTAYWNLGKDVNHAYWAEPGVILGLMRKQACPFWGYASPNNLMFNACYVLRIKVLHVSDDSDITQRRYTLHHLAEPLKCVTAQIIDTIKGKKILIGDCGLIARSYEQDGKSAQDVHPCIQFYYAPIWSKNTMECGVGDIIYGQNPYGADLFQSDSEYIVSLQVNYRDCDHHQIYFDICTMTSYEPLGGVYPIRGGKVLDAAEFFGVGTSPTLVDLEARLRTIAAGLAN